MTVPTRLGDGFNKDVFCISKENRGGRQLTMLCLQNVLFVVLFCVNFTASLVRPKIIRSVHYCPTTKKTIERKYTDMTSLDPFPSSGVYPTKVYSFVFYYILLALSIVLISTPFRPVNTSELFTFSVQAVQRLHLK